MKKKFILVVLFCLICISNSYALDIQAKAYLLKDINSNRIILSKNIKRYLPPASTTKLMTLYLLFEKIKYGNLKLTDRLTVSKKAWRKGGSKMFLDPNTKVAVVDLIKGIAVSSGNDASTVVAEYIAGSEKEFVKMMNEKAEYFGMKNTNFENPTGWDNRSHVSTAEDLAILAERIIKDFPKFYKVFSLKSFKYNKIRQYNKNTLLGSYGVDGLKTGHVHSVGYNIVSSAKRNGTRYLVVLLGAKSKAKRESEVRKLYEYAYKEYKSIKLIDKESKLTHAKTYLCDKKYIGIGLNEDLKISLTKEELENLKIELEYYPILNAPVYANQEVGTLNLYFAGADLPIRRMLVTKDSCHKITGWDKYKKIIKYKFTGNL